MDAYATAIIGLVGAVIGAGASVLAQLLTQWRITRRAERDSLRAACIDFGTCAYNLLQRIEIVLIQSDFVSRLRVTGQANSAAQQQLPTEQERLHGYMTDAIGPTDAFAAALCRVQMFCRYAKGVDNGEAIHRKLVALPTEVSKEQGRTIADASRQIDELRAAVLAWINDQSEKIR